MEEKIAKPKEYKPPRPMRVRLIDMLPEMQRNRLYKLRRILKQKQRTN